MGDDESYLPTGYQRHPRGDPKKTTTDFSSESTTPTPLPHDYDSKYQPDHTSTAIRPTYVSRNAKVKHDIPTKLRLAHHPTTPPTDRPPKSHQQSNPVSAQGDSELANQEEAPSVKSQCPFIKPKPFRISDSASEDSSSDNPRSTLAHNVVDSDYYWKLTRDDVETFRKKGADYQSWIDYPEDTQSSKPCIVKPSNLSMEDLLWPGDDMKPWVTYEDSSIEVPEEFCVFGSIDPSTRGEYHKLHMGSPGIDKFGVMVWNKYHGRVFHGALFANNNLRVDGPHWSQLAQAHYGAFHDISTLKYVFRVNIVNEETFPYVKQILYPRHGVDLLKDLQARTWLHDTDDYKELMGTALGKCVGLLS